MGYVLWRHSTKDSSLCIVFLSLSSYQSLLLSVMYSFARLFQCAAISKAREARQQKIQAYEAKKYAQARDAAALDPTGTAGHLLEQAPLGKLDPNGNYNEHARQQAGGSDDGMTSPAHSDDDEPTDEATDHNETTSDADHAVPADPHSAPLPVTSPMSVLSEQTAPELVSPPRILEKVDDGDAQNTNTADVPSALKSAGLLCGCL
jgi:hypothetical protein